MDAHAPSAGFDPARHDNEIVALFRDETAAENARLAVVQAGVAGKRVETMADGAALHQGLAHPVQNLFVPEDDYHDFHHALGRGHAMVIVRPASVQERDAAVWALERSLPMDIEEHGRHWRGVAAPVPRREINHANVSRADLHGRAVGGSDEVMLDMTGQKMTVRSMSEHDMAGAPFAPPLSPDQRPAPLALPAPERSAPSNGTTYTYGVPADVVSRMSKEEQIAAQFGQDAFTKLVGEQTQMGWRDRHPDAVRVRSYMSERRAGS